MIDRPDPSPPGVRLAAPVPPDLAALVGYRGDARYVGLCWIPGGDEVYFTDGRSGGTGRSYAFLSYRRHAAVAPHLQPYNIGSSDAEAGHYLILDHHTDHLYMAPEAEARRFLDSQHPPLPPLAPEEEAIAQQQFQAQMKALLGGELGEVPIDASAIAREMAEERNSIARMLAFLDQLIPPRSNGLER